MCFHLWENVRIYSRLLSTFSLCCPLFWSLPSLSFPSHLFHSETLIPPSVDALQYFSSIHLPSAFFHFFNYIPSSFITSTHFVRRFLYVLPEQTSHLLVWFLFFVIFARKQNGGFVLNMQPQMPLEHLPEAYLHTPTYSPAAVPSNHCSENEQKRHFPAYRRIATGQTSLLPCCLFTCEAM